MKDIRYILCATLFVLIFAAPDLYAQSWFGSNNKQFIRKGNLEYKKGNFDAASDEYKKVIGKKPDHPVAHFNMGTSLYKKGNFDSAMTHFQTAINGISDDKLKSKGYYNLGNTMLQKREYQKAIDAYKESLKANPGNEDARYNLSYARKMLQQQQQQQQKQNDMQDQNNNNDDQQQQQNKSENDEQKNDEKKNQEQQEKENQEQMSKEEAERILDALKNREKELKNQQKDKGKNNNSVEKDW